jgi:hypothetical protein
MNRYIKSYKGWKLVNEQSVIGAPNFGTFNSSSSTSAFSGAASSGAGAVSSGAAAPSTAPASTGESSSSSDASSSFGNKIPSKIYDDVKSGILNLNNSAFDAFTKYNNEVLTEDLLNSSNDYIIDIQKMKDGDLKDFLIGLSKGEGVDRTSAYKKFSSGDWSLSPLSEDGKETWIFDWVPVDSNLQKFKLKPVKSSKFSGKVSWFFNDNMFYPVISKSDSDKKVVVNGFTNTSNSNNKNTFKAGDIVYVKMHEKSLSGLMSDARSSMESYSGVQYILKDWEKNTEEHSDLFNKNKDSVAIHKLRGPDTPAVSGYIILLERPSVGYVGKSDISKGSISSGEDYVGLVI